MRSRDRLGVERSRLENGQDELWKVRAPDKLPVCHLHLLTSDLPATVLSDTLKSATSGKFIIRSARKAAAVSISMVLQPRPRIVSMCANCAAIVVHAEVSVCMLLHIVFRAYPRRLGQHAAIHRRVRIRFFTEHIA